MDQDFLRKAEKDLDLPKGILCNCRCLKETLLKVYEQTDAHSVVYVLELWDSWQGGFDEEATKVEIPADIWEKLHDLD